MSLQSQVDSWVASAQGQKKILQVTRVDESSQQLTLRLHGANLQLQVPPDEDCMFELECDSAPLSEFHAIIASYAFEQEGLTLPMLLDKMVAVYQKLFPNAVGASSIPPLAAASSSSSAAVAPASSTPIKSSSSLKEPNSSKMDVDAEDEDGFGGADDEVDATMEDDEGFGDGGDGDWGDFKESNADEEIHDNAWEKTKALKKRLIARAEEDRVQAQHATEQQKKGKDGIKTIFSSEAAVTMLVNDCMAFMASTDPALKVSAVDDSVFKWKVRLSNFPSDSKIQQGLSQLKQVYNYDHVEIEVKFMPDLYPFFPPSVRLVRPRMKHFMIGRLVCMPELQLSQWNPTRTLKDIFESIRRVLTQHGEIDDTEPEVNDPDSELQPYTALEFELLRLTMLTDIAPRVVKTMGDAEGVKLFAPKTKSKAEIEKEEAARKEEAAKAAAAAAQVPSYSYYQAPQGGGFKKGTGYGGGHRDGGGWDVEAWKAAQVKRESEICEIAHNLAMEMEKATVPKSLAGILENSCLIPFLEQYLANDSISDMESHSVIYHSILDICRNMAKHETLVPLFELLPGEKKSLAGYIMELKKSADVAVRFERFSTGNDQVSSTSTTAQPTTMDNFYATLGLRQQPKPSSAAAVHVDVYPISLLKHIVQVSEIVELAIATYRSKVHTSGSGMTDVTPTSSTTTTTSSSSSSSSSNGGGADYVALLSPYRFGEVENFTNHHYFKTYASQSKGQPRAWVKRLSTEYTDLNKALPIHPLSSTWLRYKEDAMSFCQFLIAAPDETPYGFGMFLFDAYFPNQYPAGPPLVNLQTTGGGSVRFNPNLYNCGKVCLSLLGTWSGGAGENWSPITSTFLQVIVSIQSLILVPEPYFNEPGYQSSYGTPSGKVQSDNYNKVIEVATIKYAMIDMMKRPPDWARDIVRSHFCLHRENIMKQCRKWAEHNNEVKGLLPQLQAILDEQSLPDGSKPLCILQTTNTSTASSTSTKASSTKTP